MDFRAPTTLKTKTRAAAGKIAARHLSGSFDLELLHRGNNTVYLASDGQQKLIIRLAPRYYLPVYKKAALAAKLAEAKGVPVQETLHVGSRLVPFAYTVSRYVEGVPADHFTGDRLALWHQMGSLAYKINQVRTIGYDQDLFRSHRYGETWYEFINRDLSIRQRKFPTFVHKESKNSKPFFTKDELAAIFRSIEPIRTYRHNKPRLIHLDISLRNTIVNDQGKIVALLDWDCPKSYPQPHQLATSTFWLSHEEQQAFTDGYGMNFDPDLIKAFKAYEYLTQIPNMPLSAANSAKDIILWLTVHSGSRQAPDAPAASLLQPALTH
jgi:Ser/Thr protein kinase RdoA (MazF antagonist)